MPEFHRFVLSLVEECENEPTQVQVTESFGLIVTVAGLKAKSTMLTFVLAASTGAPARQKPHASSEIEDDKNQSVIFELFIKPPQKNPTQGHIGPLHI